ncbi:MAG: ABC transporter permease [Candidatus Nanogingivalis sp.]
MFNLGTVIKFEVLRAIKKPTFWVALLAVPLVYGGIFFLGKISGEQAAQNAEKLAREEFSFEIMDESGILNQQIIESVGGKISKNKTESIEKVKNEKLNAFYFVPKNLKDQSVEIFGKFEGVNQSAKYWAVISSLLKNSSLETVNPNKLAAINETFKGEETLFKNGEKYDALKEMLVPGVFLVIFYYIVVFLSHRMLTSTTEEKENRVTEMILTSISAKTLVVGKLISILILGAIQIFALLVPILIAFLGFSKNLGLPNLSNFTDGIVWDGMTILKASLILVFGLLMTVGAIIALGSAMPTAQEASNYFGFIIMLLMAPFFVVPMFFTAEKTIAVDFLSYFPLTSPTSLLIRNTLGTLSNEEAFIGIGLLVVFGAIAIWMAVRIFQFGTLSYGKKVSLKSLFSAKK